MTKPANGGEEDDNETLMAGKTTVTDTDAPDTVAKAEAKAGIPAKPKPEFIYYTIAPRAIRAFSIARSTKAPGGEKRSTTSTTSAA